MQHCAHVLDLDLALAPCRKPLCDQCAPLYLYEALRACFISDFSANKIWQWTLKLSGGAHYGYVSFTSVASRLLRLVYAAAHEDATSSQTPPSTPTSAQMCAVTKPCLTKRQNRTETEPKLCNVTQSLHVVTCSARLSHANLPGQLLNRL